MLVEFRRRPDLGQFLPVMELFGSATALGLAELLGWNGEAEVEHGGWCWGSSDVAEGD